MVMLKKELKVVSLFLENMRGNSLHKEWTIANWNFIRLSIKYLNFFFSQLSLNVRPLRPYTRFHVHCSPHLACKSLSLSLVLSHSLQSTFTAHEHHHHIEVAQAQTQASDSEFRAVCLDLRSPPWITFFYFRFGWAGEKSSSYMRSKQTNRKEN